jgi:plastocyanin
MTSRFLPAVTTANPGDTLRFINQSGGPHNIQFFADSIPEEARTLLAAAMPGEKLDQLSSPLLVLDQATYDIAVPALPPGRYPFVCLPHAGSRMLGSLVIP